MIQSLRQIKNRIRSIQNTKKVTAAMELISVAKLNRIDKLLVGIEPYFLKLESLMNRFLNSTRQISSPFLERIKDPQKFVLVLISADSGLCSTYSSNIIHLGEEFIKSHGQNKISLICVGKKGFNYFKKQGFEISKSYLELNAKYSQKLCDEITGYLMDLFFSGQADEIYVAYTRYGSILFHKPTLIKFLNIEPDSRQEKIDYILEPDKQRILQELILRYMLIKMRLIILESFTSEHASRMIAMKTATDNALDLLTDLTLTRNKVRQAGITSEIVEIIASSEAVKG
jgi:F-type H+-transporting ATPase subunit gamma